MAEIVDDTKTFTIALTAEPGLGEIVNLDYPTTVQRGATFDVNASTKNIGGDSGSFVMELHINEAFESRSVEFGLAAGGTSDDKIAAATAPTEGESMSIVVKCIRIER